MFHAKSPWWRYILLSVAVIAFSLAPMLSGTARAAGTTYKATDSSTIEAANFTCDTPKTVQFNLSGGTYTYTCTIASHLSSTSTTYTISNIKASGKNYTATLSDGTTDSTITIIGNGVKLSTGGGTGSGSSGSNPSASPTCETSGDPLSWIICPIFNGISNASDWIFSSIVTPFLITQPIQTSGTDPSFQVWSEFRVYGDIFLVIALLVLVFGQAIGGGLIDAYTIKKALPRVLLAAILINLSIYIVAFLVDITNIVGKSIGFILIEPFKHTGQWHFKPNAGVSGIAVFAVGIMGYLLVASKTRHSIAGSLGGLFKGEKAQSSEFTKSALVIVMLVAIPILLSLLAVFITLIVRKGLILFLVLISPIAFALYCLPNTEKYFKKWWDLLLEALMVYPIIVVIFAVADILSIMILNANGVTPNAFDTGVSNVVAFIVAFLLQFLPLLAIPFAFRMAGGTLSKFHEAVTSTGGKLKQSGWYSKRREAAQGRYANAKTDAEKQWYTKAYNKAGGGAGVEKRAGVRWLPGTGAARRALGRRMVTGYEGAGGAQAALEGDRIKAIQAAGKANDADALIAGLYTSETEAAEQLQKVWGRSAGEARRGASAFQSIGIGWGGASSAAALQAIAQDGTILDGNKSNLGNANLEQAYAVATVAGRDTSTLMRLAGSVYAADGQVGRKDLADSYGTVSKRAAEVANDMANGIDVTTIDHTQYEADAVKGMREMNPAQWAGLKGAARANGTNAIMSELTRADETLSNSRATEEQKNAARVVIAQNAALIKSAQASGFYMPASLVQQVEQVTRNAGGITIKAERLSPEQAVQEASKRGLTPGTDEYKQFMDTSSVSGGFGEVTLDVEHSDIQKKATSSQTTSKRILETQGPAPPRSPYDFGDGGPKPPGAT